MKNHLTIKYFLFVCFILIYSKSYSQEWIYVTETESGNSKYYIQNKTANTYGNPKVWTKEIAKTAIYKKNGKTYTVQNATIKDLHEYDCSEKREKILKTIYYDANGKVIYSMDLEAYSKWDYVVPDSISEALIEKICELF